MRNTLRFLLAPMTLVAISSLPAQQVSVTLAPSADNTIYDFGTLSNGAGTRFFTGTDLASGSRRGLSKFDVAGSIPAGSTIVSARLELTTAQTHSTDRAVALHRLTADWGEGASAATGGQGGGAPAAPGDATWADNFFPNSSWQTAGGDFDPIASATTVATFSGVVTWSSAQMVTDVQGWLDQPATAFGWILVTDESVVQTARAFHSREAINPGDRPRLILGYDPPAASVQNVGSGCTGGGVAPLTIAANGLPSVPNPSFGITISGGPSGGLMLIDYFGRMLANPIPLGQGCFLYGDVGVLFDGVSTTGTTPLPVPNDPNLFGASLSVQGFSVVPATLQIAASNGLVLFLGR